MLFSFANGKYLIDRAPESMQVRVFRHGAPWVIWEQEFSGCAFLHAILDEVERLQGAAVMKCLRQIVEATEQGDEESFVAAMSKARELTTGGEG